MKAETARALIERCPVGLSLHGARGEFLAASDECVRIFGRSREALLQGSLASLLDERDADRVQASWDAAALGGGEATLRYRLATEAGAEAAASLVWVETDLRAVTPTADEPAAVACASRVVAEPTALAYAGASAAGVEHENLDLARRHRDALVHMLPAMVWYGHVTPDLKQYNLSYFNEYLFALTGHTREEWLGTPGYWRGLIHPDDRAFTLAATDEMLRGDRAQGPPYRLRKRDGQYLWVQSSMFIERDEQGVPLRMYGLTLDVTVFVAAREQNAALLRENAEKARRILELSAPIIPLGDDVLILPLIGSMDPARAAHALETLLLAVQRTGARRVIIDLTGVGAVDGPSALALARAARALRLLGAQPMVTGIRPEVALALLELDISLDDLKSYASLAAALKASGARR